jgi:predicted PurR-regulated permease PerM
LVTHLAPELPNYRHNIIDRIHEIRGGALEKLRRTARDVRQELEQSGGSSPVLAPVAVRGESLSPFWWRLSATIGPVLEIVVTASFVAALVGFLLVRRQELRDRLIRLVGGSRITLATKAVDEAFDRMRHYLLHFSLVNAIFGTAVAVGLSALGLPYALLWGFFAAVFRFIPYVGVWAAALLPITLSLAAFNGWTQPLLVAGLFVVLEPAIVLVLEPLVYRRSVGVSDVALLVTVAFWAGLWGPVGLLMAVPLTVCLVVVGKYVPGLEPIVILLGDESSPAVDLSLYQRLLARDQDEAGDLLEAFFRSHGDDEVYDEILLPALSYVRRDRAWDRVGEADEAFVVRAIREVVEERETPAPPVAAERPTRATRMIGYPVRGEADEVALMMTTASRRSAPPALTTSRCRSAARAIGSSAWPARSRRSRKVRPPASGRRRL